MLIQDKSQAEKDADAKAAAAKAAVDAAKAAKAAKDDADAKAAAVIKATAERTNAITNAAIESTVKEFKDELDASNKAVILAETSGSRNAIEDARIRNSYAIQNYDLAIRDAISEENGRQTVIYKEMREEDGKQRLAAIEESNKIARTRITNPNYTTYSNYMYGGQTISNFTRSVLDNVDDAAAMCDSDIQCRSFTCDDSTMNCTLNPENVPYPLNENNVFGGYTTYSK